MSKTIQNIVSKDLVVISENANLLEARAIMDENRIRHLPVLNDDLCIVGVISNSDISNASNLEEISVFEVMSTSVEFFNEKESLRPVILRMIEKKISSVLVVNSENEVFGIVTTDDLLWCFAETLKSESESPRLKVGDGLNMIGDLAFRLSGIGI